ncbi:GNAT family N-acetyltransferase [Cohaesibacter haloalkalitolerans]|uniref:GNAT family N-acetyltransferase n=1 Tax=Cohaesibacter haloalkalitolerans TaxID=1162980 RepID=UPI000E64CA86|nr:N-acetyltransferase [Cohaesibacter haloalkalitolerans]
MVIRPAQPEDASALAALSLEVWLHTYCRPGIPPVFASYALETFTKANLEAQTADPDRHFLVDAVPYAGQDGLRGYLSWCCPTDLPQPNCPKSEIDTLYIRERHKGQGVGSALLKACYQSMAGAGHTAAFLRVNAENREAITFYERKGFETIGETWFGIEGERYLNFVMRKGFV